MANTMRWRYGDTNPVMMPVRSTHEVQIGDLLYTESGEALPAVLLDQGSKESHQEIFHDHFVGVSMQSSPLGVSNPIRIATSGVFEFECQPSTVEVADLLGITLDQQGDPCCQQVEKVDAASKAIGRCCKRVQPAGTRVLVEIVSTVMRGGKPTAQDATA